MQRKLLLSGAAAALITCQPATGQTNPVLSGKYAINYTEICQARTNTTNNSAGATYNQLLVGDFDWARKTVRLTGTSVSGPLVGANGATTSPTQTAINTSYPYSNTAMTITIGSDTFPALYGPLMSGMPQWAMFGGITHDGCSASAVAIRQSPVSVPLPAE